MNVAKQMQEIVFAKLVFHTTVLCLRAYFVHMFFFFFSDEWISHAEI